MIIDFLGWFGLEIPEGAYKLLGKMTYYLFPVYIDKASKESLIKLNGLLIEFNIDNSLRPLVSSLEAHSKLCAINTPRLGFYFSLGSL